MNKYCRLLILTSVLFVGGCVGSSTSNVEINNKAREARLAPELKTSLEVNDRQLQACIIYSYLLQEERGLEPRESIIKFACNDQELNYRAAVMANVRPEWQSLDYVLNNTANTATDRLYRTVLRSLER